MSTRIPYMPFEDLEEFSELKSLINYILKSVRVKEIKVVMPGIFDTQLIEDPEAILPVYDILVGNATFSYIRSRANSVLSNVKNRIEKANENTESSFTDKVHLFQELNKLINHEYKYYNSMNAIRYMSSYQWMISYTEEVEGRTVQKEKNYPNSKVDLQEGHWNIIENTFIIRRDLVSEIRYLIEAEVEKLEEELSDTKYGWAKEDWQYELYEILIAIIASERIDIIKGSERTFAHEFLALFGKTDREFSYYKGKILDRSKPRGKNRKRAMRSIFLPVVQECLESYHEKKVSK